MSLFTYAPKSHFHFSDFGHFKCITGAICIGNNNYWINYDRLTQELPEYMQYARFHYLVA
jgi:hypothetical protein